MYTLIGSLKSRAVRVLWCLEEIGADYDFLDAAPQSPEMIAVNPSGKAPAFRADDDIIIDSAAICTFLADKHGKLTHPAGSIARAHQDSAMHLVLDEMDSILWMAAKHRFVLPQDKRCADIEAACAHEFACSMGTLSDRLGNKLHLTGGMFTIADIFAVHCANWARGMFEWDIPQDNLKAYLGRVRERTAYKRAMALREGA